MQHTSPTEPVTARRALTMLAAWMSLLAAVALVCVTAIWLPNHSHGFYSVPSVLTSAHGPVLATVGLVAGLVALVVGRPRVPLAAIVGVALCEAVPLFGVMIVLLGIA